MPTYPADCDSIRSTFQRIDCKMQKKMDAYLAGGGDPALLPSPEAVSHLTSGQAKAYAADLLTPQQVGIIGARNYARNPAGFWGTTTGSVLRAVGIAALSLIPIVGAVLSIGAGVSAKALDDAEKKKAADLLAEEQAKQAKRLLSTAAAVALGQQPAGLPPGFQLSSLFGSTVPASASPGPTAASLKTNQTIAAASIWLVIGAGALIFLLLFARRG